MEQGVWDSYNLIFSLARCDEAANIDFYFINQTDVHKDMAV